MQINITHKNLGQRILPRIFLRVGRGSGSIDIIYDYINARSPTKKFIEEWLSSFSFNNQ